MSGLFNQSAGALLLFLSIYTLTSLQETLELFHRISFL